MRAKSEVLKGPKLLRVVGLEGPIFKDKYGGPRRPSLSPIRRTDPDDSINILS